MSQLDIKKILDKPMTRRQFMQHIGLVVLSIFGINTLLSKLFEPEKHVNRKSSRGWGNGKFGV